MDANCPVKPLHAIACVASIGLQAGWWRRSIACMTSNHSVNPAGPCARTIKVASALIVLTLGVALVASDAVTINDDEFVPSPEWVEGWYARIESAEGRIVARLLPEQSPQAVAYFTGMASGTLEWFDRASGKMKKGPYYDGMRIHKAIAGQRIELGDPSGTGHETPDIFIAPEGFGPVNFNAPGRLGLTADTGLVSAVQFFATASAQPRLSGQYPCFGIVVEGREVIQNLAQTKTFSNGRPIEPVIIERIRIFKVGEPAALPLARPYAPSRTPLRSRDEMRTD